MLYSVGLIIVSDRAYSGNRQDGCVEIFESTLDKRFEIKESTIVNDDPQMIEEALHNFIKKKYSLIFTSGGTGFSNRDNTPEVTSRLLEKPTPGVDEAIRNYSLTKSNNAIYSRAVSGIVNKSFIINLPGSPHAVKEILEFLLKTIEHPLKILNSQIDDCKKDINRENLY